MQNRSSAVMQQRAAGLIASDDPQRALWRKLDYFGTPQWASRAGAELMCEVHPPFSLTVLEPACGEGFMAEPFREYFARVDASDIHDFGCGYRVPDFLRTAPPIAPAWDWVATNPPFVHAAEFITHGFRFARIGVAVLVRAAFLESVKRFALLYRSEFPLTVYAPFVERVAMELGRPPVNQKDSGATAYAWCLFRKDALATHPVLRPIPPGTRQRLTLPHDARFLRKTPSPLFDTAPAVTGIQGEVRA